MKAASALMPLTLAGATVRRGAKTLVGPIDLSLKAGGITILMGPNGAGKTTLLRAIHGLERLSAGRIAWGVPHEEARQRRAFVFQTPVMLRRTVLANIAFPLRLGGTPREAAREAAAGWAERVGLADTLRRPAEVLSGGEKQKLALARALITSPDLVLLDEPTANLDGRAKGEIEWLLTEAAATDTRVLMATHDMGQARRLAADVVLLLHGAVHAHAPAPAFFDAPPSDEAAAFIRGDIVP